MSPQVLGNISPLRGRTVYIPPGGANWWEAGSAPTPYCVYDPANAANKTASFNDLSGNGRTATENGTVSWSSGLGWTSLDTTNYVTPGGTVQPTNRWSVVVMIDNATTSDTAVYGAKSPGSTHLSLRVRHGGSARGFMTFGSFSPGTTYNGTISVAGFAGNDGASGSGIFAVIPAGGSYTTVDSTSYTATFTNSASLFIGCFSNNGTPTLSYGGDVLRIALWDTDLSAAELQAVCEAAETA